MNKGLQTSTIILKDIKSKSFSDLLKLYENHFSVLKIKEKYKIQNKFKFREVSPDEVKMIIQLLDKKKYVNR